LILRKTRGARHRREPFHRMIGIYLGFSWNLRRFPFMWDHLMIPYERETL
jgi:hypothetical protein